MLSWLDKYILNNLLVYNIPKKLNFSIIYWHIDMSFLDIPQEIKEQIMMYLDRQDILELVEYGGSDVCKYAWLRKKDKTLLLACMNRNIIGVQYLIEHGADIHHADDYALRISVRNGYLDIVKYLIEHDANVHAKNNEILNYSVCHRYLDIITYFVKECPNIDINALLYYGIVYRD